MASLSALESRGRLRQQHPSTERIRIPRRSSNRQAVGRWLARYGRLATVLAALFLLLSLGQPSLSGPLERLPLLTRHPIVGVHTRLTDEVEEWKIERSLSMVREMGAAWIVEYFPWAYVEPRPGEYDWRHADLVVDAAYRQGLHVVARVDYVPAWARPNRTTSRYLEPAQYDLYAEFLFRFVKRYGERIRYYLIWNEPNLTAEWGFRPVSAAEYTELLRVTYRRIKEADPAAQVVAAGLAPTLERSEQGLDDLSYLQQMYDAGARDAFDAMSIHAYGWKFPPDDPPAPDRINFARAALIRDVMVRNGDAAKPAIITEGGWNDYPRWTKAVRPAQRAQYTVRAYEKVEQDWPWALAVCLWQFRLPTNARNYNDGFTFVTVDFRPRPVYEAVKAWATR
ncbi:MAG: beta-galactosidase [Chloroflexi bacterium]|nr:beta-galactosidase [Chloroflexota bacterium]